MKSAGLRLVSLTKWRRLLLRRSRRDRTVGNPGVKLVFFVAIDCEGCAIVRVLFFSTNLDRVCKQALFTFLPA